ncbi:MAG: hypothetical protein KA371_09780 [Acidobacteria bacterium]|nr:hypothetical protein [Acidobacteriota bacterium]
MIRTTFMAALAALIWLTPVALLAQAPPSGQSVEADPVRCWWRTDKAAVRMGEPFSTVLTCAVLETASTKAVVDRSRLDHTVMALPPFDVLDGGAGQDVVSGARRFFQYSYVLRLLDDTSFGQDVTLAGLSIGYRLDTATADGTTSQGRDQTYGLPPLTVRVIALVAGSARDIRDSTSMTFTDLDARRFRARTFGMAGWFFYALAAGVAALGLARLYRAMRAPAASRAVATVSSGAVLKAAARELVEVAREKQGQGWTDGLVGRAGAALRIIASYAVGQPATQTRGLAANVQGGQIALSQGLIRRRHALVSAAVTPEDLTGTAAGSSAVQQLKDGLVTLTAARFGRATLDEGSLDVAVQAAGPLARSLALRYSWPMVQWQKMESAVASWRGRA